MNLSPLRIPHMLDAGKFRMALSYIASSLGRLAYPPHCVACGAALDENEDRYLCRACIARINFVKEPTCRKCGHELGPHQPDRRCLNCRNVPLRFDKAIAAAHHSGIARDLVLALKFGGQMHVVYPISTMLSNRLADCDLLDRVQIVAPVPLHRARQRTRGFNQAELIAEDLAERCGLPFTPRILARVTDTPPQTHGMSLASRRQNVKGAFAVIKPKIIAGKTILLIDDVLTTGATTSECAGVLKRAGAKTVYVATITRRMLTPPTDDFENETLLDPTEEVPDYSTRT